MKPELKTIKLSDIIFDEVIYPRRTHDPILVQQYADTLEQIEIEGRFISVSSDMKLLDGKHRWLAYRKNSGDEDREIQVFVYPLMTPHEQLTLAARLNSSHGKQLSLTDKEETAKTLYSYGMSYEGIASALSVGKQTINKWLARTVKENKEKRDRTIKDMWLACYTQEEIAETVGCDQATVTRLCSQYWGLSRKLCED
jgi:transposase